MSKHLSLRAQPNWLATWGLAAGLAVVTGCGGDGGDDLLAEGAPSGTQQDGAIDAGQADEDAAPDALVEEDGSSAETSDGGEQGAADAESQLDAADSGETDAASAAPTITLLGASELVLDCGEIYVEPGFAAVDELGQTLAVEVVEGSVINTATPGTSTIRYRATSAAGVSTERTRVVQVCGVACGELGKQNIDLSTWQSIQYEQNYQPNALWTVAADKLSVVQSVNADASIFLADFDATDFAVEGRWRMGSSSDDDFVGFVFGYQDRGHFYLFDWKQGTQSFFGGLAEVGMTLKVVNAAPADAGIEALELSSADLWYSAGTPNVAVMQKDGAPLHNSIPWAENVDYFFFLEFHAGSFRIDVRDAAGATLVSWSVVDSTYTAGAFGFYNFSQGPVTYQSFTRRVTPVACSTLQ